jgi:D-serine deaminase-like pyridoxal phosphate-dependent protein
VDAERHGHAGPGVVTMRLAEVPTPALLLDRDRLARNAARMTAHVAARGLRLRPHLKTAKSIDAARYALAGNFGGITVSTLTEAEYFAGHGIGDILYAVGIVPDKLDRVAALLRRGVNLTVITDDAAVAAAVGARGAALGVRVPVMVEIDVGEARGGVHPASAALLEIGHALTASEGADLVGVMAHAGQSYAARSTEAVAAVALDEADSAVLAARRLRGIGLACPVVSVGSTPTVLHGPVAPGVTELRCGVYMFGDLFQAQIGSCALDDLAVSVLATVIGHRRDPDRLIIDAGALALSKDRSTAGMPLDAGFGLVVDAAGRPLAAPLRVDRVYQEHGVIELADPRVMASLPIGSRVRVLPNHVCMTAAMYDRYLVVDGDGAVRDTWHRCNGWGDGGV